MTDLAGGKPGAPPEAPEDLHERYFGHEHVTVIERARGWRLIDFRELWAYRELLIVLVKRDVSVRYKQTVLGAAWAVFQPITTMIVFSVVFGRFASVPSDGLPYPVFVYAALLPWNFFSSSLQRVANSVVGSSEFVSKIYVPRLIIPLAAVGSGTVDLAISTVVMLVLMQIFDVPLTLDLLAVPFLIPIILMIALGVGTFICALNVAYRDFQFLAGFLVQLWMYATPVIYPASIVPEKWRWLLYVNPMAGVIDAFRFAFLGRPLDLPLLATSLGIAAVLFVIGLAYFERVERSFADVI